MESGSQAAINVTGDVQVQTDSTVLSGEEAQSIVTNTPIVNDGGQLPSEITNEKILGKFTSQEELIKAYQELQAKLGGGQESPQVTEPSVEPPVAEVPSSIVEEYATKIVEAGGTITPEIYKELEGKGYSKDFVDTYVKGVQAQEQAAFQSLVSDIGGVEVYSKAAQWAQANMTQEQITAYNNSLSKATPEVAKIIMEALITKANKGTSQPTGAPIHSNIPIQPPVGNSVYESKSDYMKDANDPRYHKDPAYRSKVEQKLGRTDMSTWYTGLSRGL